MTNERPTPETDAAAEEVGMGHFMVDADFARKLERGRAEAWACCDELVVDSNAITLAKTVMRLERERDELLQWKKETLLVESQWDEQAVGRLLGLRLGDFIKPNIEPKLRQLIKERDEAREALSEIALYLSVGMGDETTTAQQYQQRILEGIKMLTEPIAELWKQAEKERDELIIELKEYRSIAESIGATKAISEKEKAIRERDEAMAERDRYKRQWEESRMETVEVAK